MYNDKKIRQGKILGENKTHFCIKAMVAMGFFYRYRWDWVSKSDPAICKIRWNPQAKLALTVILCLVIIGPYVLLHQLTPINYGFTEIDEITGLPVAGYIFYPDKLPDGHYTVEKVVSDGADALIIQHQPGPYRDFAYYVHMNVEDNVPDNCQDGQRFEIFQAKIVNENPPSNARWYFLSLFKKPLWRCLFFVKKLFFRHNQN